MFDPMDYGYMDNLPLEGWIWEFVRRSAEYCTYYHKLMELSAYDPEIMKEFGKLLTGEADDYTEREILHSERIKQYIESNYCNFGCFTYAFRNPSEKWKKKFEAYDGMVDYVSSSAGTPEVAARNASKFAPIHIRNLRWGLPVSSRKVRGVSGELILRENNKKSCQYGIALKKDSSDGWHIMKYRCDSSCTSHPLDVVYEHQGNQNVLMVLLDISTPMNVDNLLDILRPQLVMWRRQLALPEGRAPKKQNKNLLTKKSTIWKSYLIIYDLYSEYRSYSKVCDALIKYNYDDVKIIELHYKAAKKLIGGGYRKFL